MDLVIFEDSVKYDIGVKGVLISSVLPRTIAVLQEGLILRFWAFSWKIPCATIRSIRVSPSRRDQFLEYALKAFADWKNTHPA
jgi:hypothetical protein